MIKNGIMRAFYFAENAHRDQVRKLGHKLPYVTHLKAVARYVEGAGGSETQIIVALLHDSLEDYTYTDLTLDDLEAFFNEDIVKGVLELSKKWLCVDTMKEKYGDGYFSFSRIIAKDNIRSRTLFEKNIDSYYSQISEEMWLVKLYDRLHNLMFLDTDCPESKRIDFIYSYIRNTNELLKHYKKQGITNFQYDEIIKEIEMILKYLTMKWKKYHGKNK